MKRITTEAAEPQEHRTKPPTVRDVARRAGLSQAAVSYALAGPSPRVSDQTRQRVLQAAAELGYQPNVLARVMKGKEAGLLGIIVRDGGAPTAAEVCRTLMTRAPAYGYDIILTDAGNSATTLLRLANLMKSRLCDGLFLVGELPDQDMHWDAYERLGVPTVALLHGDERAYPGTRVSVERRSGLREALDHLYELGHRHIGFVGSDLLNGLKERRRTFVSLMRERGLPLPKESLLLTDFSREGGRDAMRRLMSMASPPTAVLACADLVASGMLVEARRAGVAVPGDISVVGYDDNPEAEYSCPTLTTVHQPIAEMADRALEWFQSRRAGGASSLDNLVVNATLVVRESTGPAPLDGPAKGRAHTGAVRRGRSSVPGG